jgi:hypothetical protein
MLQIGYLIAILRLAKLYFISIIAMSRLEQCMFLMFARGDGGYQSFLGMVLMIHVLNLRVAVDEQASSPDIEQATGPVLVPHSSDNGGAADHEQP